MRKIVLSILILIASIGIHKTTNAGDRRILVERFTSSTCVPCAGANPTLDAFLNASDPNKVLSISYHMNWPPPGNDPMYLANPSDNGGRRTYYNVNSIPNWKFDGLINIVSNTSGELQSAFQSRTDVLSPVTIVVYETISGNNVTVRAEIYCETVLSNPNAMVHFAVMEKLIQYPSPPGNNGETHFADVMRKMLPSSVGTPVVLLPGRVISMEYSYTIDPTWQPAQVRNIVFVQGSPFEIYNTGAPTLDFNLISTPAFKVVNQGQSQEGIFEVKIPSVAAGYNSPVTFTAEVLPATPGITTQFTNGNILSSFPGSLEVKVASTSAVPAGEYKVVLTGTSASGKVHKTIVNYLVGKSYITVGTNRNQVSFKVDNTSYNTNRVFIWDLSSSHTIEALSPQTFGNLRYVYTSWSNGGPQIQTITIGTQESNYTANYKVQYKLIGSVEPAGIPATVVGANSYYDSASVYNLSVSALQVQFNGKTYYFNRWEGSGNGSYTGPDPTPDITMNTVLVQKAIFDTINVGISNYNSLIPDKFALYQNYPNPFNPTTNIRFDIPKQSFTSIIIYDMLGKEIAKLLHQDLSPGSYEYNLNASNFPSGIYYYRIKTETYTEIKKMLLIK